MANPIDLIITKEALTAIDNAIAKVNQLDKELAQTADNFVANSKKMASATSGITPTTVNGKGQDTAKLQADLEKLQAKYVQLSNTISKEAEKSRLAEIKLQQQREKAFAAAEKQAKKEEEATKKAEGNYQRLQNSVNAMTTAYNNLSVRKQLGGTLTDKEEKQLESLQKRIGDYNEILRKTDSQIGKNQRNVGNYASGYNALGNSINQLTREAPAFANSMNTGFMAISNNIPALTDAIAGIRKQNELLRAEGKPTQSVLSQLGSAFFSWNTLISVGVTLLTVYGGKLIEYIFNTDAAKKATEDLTKSLKDNEEQVNKNIKTLQYQAQVDESLAKRKKESDIEVAKIRTKLGLNEVAEYEKNYNTITKKLREFDDYRLLLAQGGNKAFMSLVKKNNGDVKKAREEYISNENKFTDENRKLLVDAQSKAYDLLKEQNDKNVADGIQADTEAQNKLRDERKKAREDLLKDLAELGKKEIELLIAKNEVKLNDEDQYYTDRLTALDRDFALRNALAKKDYDEEKRLAKDSQEKKKIAYINYQIDLLKLTQDYAKKRSALERLDLDALPMANIKGKSPMDVLAEGAKNAQKELEKLGETIYKNNAGLLKAQAITDEWLGSFTSEFLQNSGFKSIESYFNGEFNSLLYGAADGDKWKVYFNGIAETAQETFNFISELTTKNFDSEKERLQNQYDVSLKFAGDNKAAQEKLAEDLEIKKKEIANREAKAKQKQALFNIAIDTAQAIVSALPNLILAGVIGSIGVAQAVAVVSQDIPQYWMGGTHEGGLMMVNDGKGSNYRETIVTPDGKISQPTGRNVLMNAPAGTEIFTHDQWNEKLTEMLQGKGIDMPKSSNAYYGLSKADMREVLEETIGNQPKQFTNFDGNGFSQYTNNRGNITKRNISRANGRGLTF